ncbi:hypothetical protein SC206_18970 [Rouxiella sp. T17]|uniref:hypothetical protein n=1 Tax=Rouxiella sp. T17 TaxID=3085684 RepID=UPI002FC9A8AA
MSNIYNYIDEGCGSGKTHWLINEINATKERYIIVQTKLDLLVQTFKEIPSGKIIDSNDFDEKNVEMSIVEFLKFPNARVLGITHKSFAKIDPNLLLNWDIYLDDIVSFHDYNAFNESDPKVKAILENDIFTNFNKTLASEKYLLANKKQKIKGDFLIEISKKFDVIQSNDYFALNASYFSKLENKDYNPEITQLTTLAWTNINKYSKCKLTFMANNFKQSLLYLSNPSLFTHKEIPVRARKIPVSERLKVKYFCKSFSLTKNYRTSFAEDFSRVVNYINKELKGIEYYYTKNSKERFELNGLKVPFITRGMNNLQKYNTAVWLSSAHPAPVEEKMVELFLNITSKQIVQCREYEALEQFVQRGVLRDFDSDEIMTVYVFDEKQAMSLCSKGGDIEYIDIGLDDNEGEKPKKSGGQVKESLIDVPKKLQDAFSQWKKSNKEKSDLLVRYEKWKTKQLEAYKKLGNKDFENFDKQIYK